MDFLEFPKITRLNKTMMSITQKIHGSNGCIRIWQSWSDDAIEVNGLRWKIIGSKRSGDVSINNDNFGFAAWIEENKEQLIRLLGAGRHYGEWAGPGINSGEGLNKKTFVLFNHHLFKPDRPLPDRVAVVPVLYNGPYDTVIINDVMMQLKDHGSYLVNGYMHPEGIVINVDGTRYKCVFEPEETGWTKCPKSEKKDSTSITEKREAAIALYGHLLQPVRMEKLLSRDETFVAGYPKTLPKIVNAYFDDLVSEGQISGDFDVIQSIKEVISSEVFRLARSVVENC